MITSLLRMKKRFQCRSTQHACARALLVLAGVGWGVAAHAQDVLVLTDASPPNPAVNGDTHTSDLITAFTNAGASITTNTVELTNGLAMAPSLVTGWDVVIVVTVAGAPIDVADVPVLQNAVDTRASRAFMFFNDACLICTVASAIEVVPIVNAVGGWTAVLGSPEITYPYVATLNGAGPYNTAFASLPMIQAGAYAPLLNVPAPNVIYTADASVDGPMAVVAVPTSNDACVFMTTDTTEFWVTGGIITSAQANALATAYLDTATSRDVCPQTVVPVLHPTMAALLALALAVSIALMVNRRLGAG